MTRKMDSAHLDVSASADGPLNKAKQGTMVNKETK